jgi:hypothetical protein
MVSFIVQIAHEPWHSEDKTHDFVFKQNECCKMLNKKRWICMLSLSTNKCYNGWKKLIDFLNLSCWSKVINIGILTSHQSCLFWYRCNLMSHHFRVNLRSNYVEYTNFYIRGKIITPMNITHEDYVKMLPCGANTCTFYWTLKRALNSETLKCHSKEILLDFSFK